MKPEELKDKIAGLEAETASVSSLLLYIAGTLPEESNDRLIDALCSIASHVEHISSEIGNLFLQA